MNLDMETSMLVGRLLAERNWARGEQNEGLLFVKGEVQTLAAECDIANYYPITMIKAYRTRISELRRAGGERQMRNLMDVLGSVDTTDWCDSQRYRRWETEVAEPRLTELGYRVVGWEDGERDSFGPLTRIVNVRLADDSVVKFIYG